MADLAAIRHTLEILFQPRDVFELRAFDAGYRNRETMGGWYTYETIDAAVDGTVELIEQHKAPSVYVTLNVVVPDLLARAANRIITFDKGKATSDDDILARKWILIDCDPTRKSGISSTNEEMNLAIGKTVEVCQWLQARGFKAPLNGYSGNGGHGLFRIDLPNDPGSTDLIRSLLQILADRFNDKHVEVDVSVYNAARITKLFGVPVKKGDSTPERPHRMSELRVVPDWTNDEAPDAGVTPRTIIETVVASHRPSVPPRTTQQAQQGSNRSFDVRRFLSDHRVAFQERTASNKTLLELVVCPFCNKPEGNPAVLEESTGRLLYQCFKDQCVDKTWHDFRALYERDHTRTKFDRKTAGKYAIGGWPAGRITGPEGVVAAIGEGSRGSDFMDSELESGVLAVVAVVAPPFPIDAIPEPIRSYITDQAQAMDVPIDFIAGPMLAITGGAMGNRHVIRMKNGFEEYPTLWVGVVGGSGTAKSPAMGKAQAPLEILQQNALKAFEVELAEWEALKDMEPDRRSQPLGRRPNAESFFTSDSTPEALVEQAMNSTGTVLLRDELVGFIGGMDAYKSGGKGAERQLHMSNWAGTMIKVDRKSKDTLYVEHPVIPIVGGIQPAMLNKLSDEAHTQDGFLMRFLFSYPETWPMKWNETEVPQSRIDEIAGLFQTLRCGEGGYVTLSPSARRLWIAWHDRNSLAAESQPSLLSGYYAKLPRQVARIALILHAQKHPSAPSAVPVNDSTMADSVEIIEYFRAHAHKVLVTFGAAGNLELTGTPEKVYRRLLSRERKWFTIGEVGRLMPNTVTASEYRSALSELAESGLMETRFRETTDRGGTPTGEYRLLDTPTATTATTARTSVLSSNAGDSGGATTTATTPVITATTPPESSETATDEAEQSIFLAPHTTQSIVPSDEEAEAFLVQLATEE